MENVSSIKPAVKATVDDVTQFADNLAERGDRPANSARLEVSALRQLVSVLQPDESSDPVSLLNGLEDLGRRFAIKNPQVKSQTVRTYMVRGRRVLEDFLRFTEDPTNFKVRVRTVAKPRPKKADKGSVQERAKLATASDAELRTFPLPDGRAVRFALPQDWSRDDAALFMCHVMTLARDFHPRDLQRFDFGE